VEHDRPTSEILHALKARGYRMTPQRRAIVAEITKTAGHIAPQEVAARVKWRMPGVNDSTVYRTLDLLEEMGFLAHAHLGAGPAYHRAGEHDHVHLICERCGADDALSVEEAEPLRDLISAHNGFLPDFTHFAISGLCRACQAGDRETKPGSNP
jgi:Fur family transcriptional regulator, ferric uptake regulator